MSKNSNTVLNEKETMAVIAVLQGHNIPTRITKVGPDHFVVAAEVIEEEMPAEEMPAEEMPAGDELMAEEEAKEMINDLKEIGVSASMIKHGDKYAVQVSADDMEMLEETPDAEPSITAELPAEEVPTTEGTEEIEEAK